MSFTGGYAKRLYFHGVSLDPGYRHWTDVTDWWKITKVLCISYIKAHYRFLIIDKVNYSVDIVQKTWGLGYIKNVLTETYLEYITNILVVLKWGEKKKKNAKKEPTIQFWCFKKQKS